MDHADKDKALEPYALAIGYLTIDWNDLHLKLAFLFARILTGTTFGPAHYV
jgi:hypothetical protein